MKRGSPDARRRSLRPPALALAVVGLLLLLAVGAAGEERGEQRPAADGGAAPPRQPIRSDEGSRTAPGGPLTLRGRALVAGRPGQRLRVGVRIRRSLGPAPRVRVRLRRIARDDPRHPGASIGGELAGAALARSSGRRARVRLRGLNPLPGPHRLSVRAVRANGQLGPRIAGARVEVFPQDRQPAGAEGKRAKRAGGSRAQPAPAPRRARARRALSPASLNQDLSFRPGPEASSAIAVARDNPARVIVAANFVGAAPRAFLSRRGLAVGSVVERPLPARTRLPNGSDRALSPCCDPAVAADREGNLWLAAATTDPGGRIIVNRAAAGQNAFRASSVGLPIAAGAIAQAQPALAVRGGDRIAAAWIETLGGVQNVVLSQCDISAGAAACDAAGAWSPPVAVTTGSGLYAMPAIEFAPGGDLYAVWWDAGADNAVEINRCRRTESCSAATGWDEEATVARLDAFDDDGAGGPDPLPLFCPIIAAPGGFVNPSPDVDVGPDGTVFVAYGDLRDNPDPRAPSRCRAGGADKTWDSFVAAGAAPDALPAPGSGVRVSHDRADAVNDHFLPALSVDPGSGAVEVSYYSTAGDPSGQRATREYAASPGGGLGFSTRATISGASSRFSGPLSDGVDYGGRQGADSAAGEFRVAWTDNRALQGRDSDLYALAPPVDTRIVAAPSGTVETATSSFRFSTPAPRIECRLDEAQFSACPAELTVGPLPNGPHTLIARATDRAGNVLDPTPAVIRWTVADHDPPETTITRKPRNPTRNKRPRFEFVADEPEARFQCRYDDGPWLACRTPKRAKVTVGRHRFGVRAIDVGGNVDPTPAFATFKRKRQCPKRDRRRGNC
jgi:hypothetical protein